MNTFLEQYKHQLSIAKQYVQGLAKLQDTYNVAPIGGLKYIEHSYDVLGLILENDSIGIQIYYHGWDWGGISDDLVPFPPEDWEEELVRLENEELEKIRVQAIKRERMVEAAKLLEAEQERKEFERLKAKFGV